MKKVLSFAGCLAMMTLLASCTADEMQTPQAKKTTTATEASFMKDGDPGTPDTGDNDRDKTKT